MDLFLDAHAQAPKEIVLDLDATDDPLHGHQEGRFFHGYYDCYCYLPLYVFCGRHLLAAKLQARQHRRLGWRGRGGGAHRRPGPRPLAEGADRPARRRRLRAGALDGLVRGKPGRLPVRPRAQPAPRRAHPHRARLGRADGETTGRRRAGTARQSRQGSARATGCPTMIRMRPPDVAFAATSSPPANGEDPFPPPPAPWVPLLVGEDVLDMGADLRLGGIGAGDLVRHGLAHGLRVVIELVKPLATRCASFFAERRRSERGGRDARLRRHDLEHGRPSGLQRFRVLHGREERHRRYVSGGNPTGYCNGSACSLLRSPAPTTAQGLAGWRRRAAPAIRSPLPSTSAAGSTS